MAITDYFSKRTVDLHDRSTMEKNILFFQELKSRIHRRMIERIDLGKIDQFTSDDLAREIGYIIENLIVEEGVPLNQQEKERIIVEVQHETFGLGPLEPLLADPAISDILVNNSNSVYVERHGKLEKTEIVFRDNRHLLQIIERIVSKVGRRIDESSPYVDARLTDGSRVNAIIPPLAIDGPVLSIRRFGADPLRMEDLLLLHSIDERMKIILEG